MTATLRVATAICANDLAVELRRPVGAVSALLLGAGSLVALHLAIAGGASPPTAVAAGALWIVLTYSALLSIGRVTAIEREEGTWDALLLAGSDRSAIFLGKAASAALQAILQHAVLVPLYLLLFETPPAATGIALLAVAVVLFDVGLAATAVLVGVLALRARGRELLSAAMLLPLTMPALVAAVTLSLTAYGVGPAEDATRLLLFLAAYDLTFLAVGVAAVPELAIE